MYEIRTLCQFDMAIEPLYQHWLIPELMAQWLVPVAAASVNIITEPFSGGGYQISYQLDGQPCNIHGHYRTLVRPCQMLLSWYWQTQPQTTLIALRLNAISQNTTELLLRHTSFKDIDSRNLHRTFWQEALARLRKRPAC